MNLPDVLYHITDANRVQNIIRNGLSVGQERASLDYGGEVLGVYLTDDWKELLSYMSDFVGRRLAVFEIDIKGIKNHISIDPEFDESGIAYYSSAKITPNRIKLLGSVDFTSPKRKGTSFVVPDIEA